METNVKVKRDFAMRSGIIFCISPSKELHMHTFRI